MLNRHSMALFSSSLWMNCASVPCSESEATTRSSRNPTFNNKKYIQPAVGCKVLKQPTFSGVEYPPTPGYDAKGIFHQEPWKAVIGRCLEDSGQVWKVVPIRDEHLKAYQYLKQDFPNNQLIELQKKSLTRVRESPRRGHRSLPATTKLLWESGWREEGGG